MYTPKETSCTYPVFTPGLELGFCSLFEVIK